MQGSPILSQNLLYIINAALIVTSSTIDIFFEITKFSKILSKLTLFSKILSKFDKIFENFRKKCQFRKYFRKFCNFEKSAMVNEVNISRSRTPLLPLLKCSNLFLMQKQFFKPFSRGSKGVRDLYFIKH